MVRPLTPGKFAEKGCLNCGQTMRSYASNPKKYCSRSCLQKYAHRDNDCLTCGTPIAVPKSHGRKFCSMACRAVAARLESGRALRNEAVATYKRHAEERGIHWLLSDKEVDQLFAGNCHWCGDAPSNRRFRERNHGDFIYNGIDRLDSSQDYVRLNCVSCCFTCNSMKRDFSPEVFVDKANKIARRHGCGLQ